MPDAPDLARGNLIRLAWQPEYDAVGITANGWLFGVILENGNFGYMSGEFRITDVKDTREFGRFTWEYAMHTSGIIFPVPLPNFNSAEPFIIRRLPRKAEDSPIFPVIISIVGTW
jgi:hypothetical protein